MHIDQYREDCDAEYKPVDTYFSLARGLKHVIMLPPGQTLFQGSQPFPLLPAYDVLEAILAAGGYIFDLEPIDRTTPSCLYIPKGWHHWLLGGSKWAVAYGGSRL
jgi:hypothetical protein